MRSIYLFVTVVASVAVVSSCSSDAGSLPSQPQFKVVAAHWLLCPQAVDDLKGCCPQPADPRRCVFPNGSAPTDLVAFARFTNSGAPGGATATFTGADIARSNCIATVPYTQAGATSSAWCSLGPVFEPTTPPVVVIHVEGS